MKIVLASKSPRRQKILSELGIKFIVISENADESLDKDYSPAQCVKILAKRKLDATLKCIDSKDTLVIAADTVVFLDKKILGKPVDDNDAFAMLRSMSGTYHSVYSGVAAHYNGTTVTSYEKTKIKFRDISDKEIKKYIATGEHKDKAGSYGIQEKGGYFTEKVVGDINNVVGLPVLKLRNMIYDAFKIDLFDIKNEV